MKKAQKTVSSFLFHKYCVILRAKIKSKKNNMKTKHLISVMFGCLTALFVTSCLSSEDDNYQDTSINLSRSEIAQCFQTVGGHYTGDLIHSADNSQTYDGDTIVGTWYIPTDSTMIITNFPSRLLAENISYQPLREAMEAEPDQTISCKIEFITKEPLQFLINPGTLTYYLHYAGVDHKVYVVFLGNSGYSFGNYDTLKDELSMQIVESNLYIDGLESTYLSMAPFHFVSKKKE